MLALLPWLLLQLAPAPMDVIRDPVVLDFCRLLVRKAASERFQEQGAFVARTKEGTLYFVVWAPGEEKNLLRWRGRFPAGTIAIVHTHPAWQPDASKLDRRAARRAGVPVYVLTPARISRTTGEASAIVMADWMTADGAAIQ